LVAWWVTVVVRVRGGGDGGRPVTVVNGGTARQRRLRCLPAHPRGSGELCRNLRLLVALVRRATAAFVTCRGLAGVRVGVRAARCQRLRCRRDAALYPVRSLLSLSPLGWSRKRIMKNTYSSYYLLIIIIIIIIISLYK